ncbi:helix-turn-helix transcriptional regulator [Pseudonocardia asaccharolytica]|uniref:LuxR family transcriptional regulator n=1 Tax=Pseudonocardia asaccharolytica DSM 44247 = NBRC 16224 TaxID=1123024 RepID=A0A511CVQ0_9PSEU|nr:LuxR family transcriptional regulator [Pseudonocardia asaccharolytica]GEL16313.1 LuxR family transcriptional regulator [Pseudonocardia asaccharolytica DSM 44247 = NBRC 16224]
MTDVARLGFGIPLVGRRSEVRVLSAALDRAAAGSACAVLLSGEAGVGKTRLITEAAERAGAAGFVVLTGRCLDTGESALPYLPFTEALGRLAADRPEVVAAHPELRRLLPGGRPRAELSADDRDLGQLRMFDAALSGLAELSAKAPVLLVLEDLHWADRSSRDLLVFLVSRLGGQRLVVLASYRDDDLHSRHPLRPLLAELVRLPAVERLDLTPLGRGDALALVRSLADGSLDERALHRIARRSEGNAFFAEELVSASGEAVPDGLAEVLLARLERLPATAQRVLRLAAVAGRRVRHDRLAAVSGLGTDELEQALRDAVAHHVLVPDSPGADDAYLFRHALLHEAVYQDLLPGERSRLHGAYAALLAEAGNAPGSVAELAHHALAAHDLPLALSASIRAVDEADQRGGPGEVLLHAERALDLWPAVPDAERLTGVPEAIVTRWAAWAASATGDPDRGMALARRALELADQRDDPCLAADLRIRYAIQLLELGRAEAALPVVQQAMTVLEDAPESSELAWARAVAARVMLCLDDVAEAGRGAQLALRTARSLGSARGSAPGADHHHDALGAEADALVTLALCAENLGRGEQARARLAEAKQLAHASGNLGVELRSFFNTGISLLDAGRLAEAAAEFVAGETRAVATGTTWSGYGLELRVAHVLTAFMRGAWDDAEAAAELGRAAVSATVAGRVAAAELLTTVGRGRLAAAEHRRAQLVATGPTDDQMILLIGQAGAESALWQGQPELAAERVDEALRGVRAWDRHHLAGIMLCALGVAAQAELAAGGSAKAVAAAEALAADGHDTAAKGRPRGVTLGVESRAWLRRIDAELSRARGCSDPQAWAQVVEGYGYEDGYRQAMARWRRAEALLAGCTETTTPAARAEAAAELNQALATAESLGAAPLAATVRALAGRAGLGLAREEPIRRPAAKGPDPLTPRERSVLALVAGGRTNKQVGAELFISEKTVSVHLSRVMAKLGAGSRTEAVSIAYARGLLLGAG